MIEVLAMRAAGVQIQADLTQQRQQRQQQQQQQQQTSEFLRSRLEALSEHTKLSRDFSSLECPTCTGQS